jgi:hypothetical protein
MASAGVQQAQSAARAAAAAAAGKGFNGTLTSGSQAGIPAAATASKTLFGQ